MSHDGNPLIQFSSCRASYRDLLRTAESIVEMDENIHRVEANLSDVSRKCNSKVIDGIARNYGDFERQRKVSGISSIATELNSGTG